VHRAFRLRFNIQPPTKNSICRWNHQFEQTGCLFKGKSSGRPRVSEENVRRIQDSFERSPRKSTRRAIRELGMPQPTVWRVLRRRLLFKPYRLQLVVSLSPSFWIILYNLYLGCISGVTVAGVWNSAVISYNAYSFAVIADQMIVRISNFCALLKLGFHELVISTYSPNDTSKNCQNYCTEWWDDTPATPVKNGPRKCSVHSTSRDRNKRDDRSRSQSRPAQRDHRFDTLPAVGETLLSNLCWSALLHYGWWRKHGLW